MSLKQLGLAMLFSLIIASGCVTTTKQPGETAPPEVPQEEELAVAQPGIEAFQKAGLSTGQPGMNTYPTDRPGKTTKLERPYDGAPPPIPHSVVGFDISRSANDCLNCHLNGVDLGEGHVATKVPASHYTNEYTGEHSEDSVVGIRYNCLQCHVPQSGEEPPVLSSKE